jgi:hypothetical protein
MAGSLGRATKVYPKSWEFPTDVLVLLRQGHPPTPLFSTNELSPVENCTSQISTSNRQVNLGLKLDRNLLKIDRLEF